MNCPKCNAVLGDEHRFCPHCGANLDPASGAMQEYLSSHLQQEVRNALKSETRDQKWVEIETAQAVVSRLTEWAKIFAFLVGIPAAVVVAVLSFLGFKTYSDVSAFVESAKEVIQTKVDAVGEKADGLSRTADQLEREVGELAKRRDELRKEQDQLTNQLADVGRDLKSLRRDLGTQLKNVKTNVHQLENRLLRFESSSALTPAIERSLAALAARYHAYLTNVGFRLEAEPVSLRIDPELKDNSYYIPSSRQLVLGPLWAEDPDVFMREYNHHALASQLEDAFRFPAVESALADYFACSFQDDPALGEIVIAKLSKADINPFKEYIRNLENELKFDDVPDEIHPQGEVLGGVLWDVRELIGQQECDRLVLDAWNGLEDRPRRSADEIGHFANALLAEAAEIEDGAYVDAIRGMFQARGLDILP